MRPRSGPTAYDLNSPSLQARFWSKVRYSESCWQWSACVGSNGYGKFKLPSIRAPFCAHRVAYEFVIGKIPDGMFLDHLCRNRACVNPSHLEPVDARTNILRGVGFAAVNAAKKHCNNGHPFTQENTYIMSDGGRRCRTCQRASDLAYDERGRRAHI